MKKLKFITLIICILISFSVVVSFILSIPVYKKEHYGRFISLLDNHNILVNFKEYKEIPTFFYIYSENCKSTDKLAVKGSITWIDNNNENKIIKNISSISPMGIPNMYKINYDSNISHIKGNDYTVIFDIYGLEESKKWGLY